MSRLNTLRLAVAAVLVTTLMGSAMLASARSATAMANAQGQSEVIVRSAAGSGRG